MRVYREGEEGPYTSDGENRSVPYGSTHQVTGIGGLAFCGAAKPLLWISEEPSRSLITGYFYAAFSGCRGCSPPMWVISGPWRPQPRYPNLLRNHTSNGPLGSPM